MSGIARAVGAIWPLAQSCALSLVHKVQEPGAVLKPDWLLNTLGIAPGIPAVASWISRCREGGLLVRFMGLTAGLATFVVLALPLIAAKLIRQSKLLDPRTLLIVLTASVMVGLAGTTSWPLFARVCARKGAFGIGLGDFCQGFDHTLPALSGQSRHSPRRRIDHPVTRARLNGECWASGELTYQTA